MLEMTEKFSAAAASHAVATDYGKLDCTTSIFMSFFSRSQSLAFWKALFPVLNTIFSLHGATLMARENDRFLKQVAFHLLRLAVFRNESVRRRAVLGLQILVRVRPPPPLSRPLLALLLFILIYRPLETCVEFLPLLRAHNEAEGYADYYIVGAHVRRASNSDEI